jgi:Alkylmercury lyase
VIRPRVEILYFEGCPNHVPAVERVAGELHLRPDIELIEVPDDEAAARLRFVGSPTVRVEGRDVEPGAEERGDFALSCRVFRTEAGIAGQPDERWVRDALLRETGAYDDTPAFDALRAADIRPERHGAARTHQLSPGQRDFYVWILREFAAGRPPTADATRVAASSYGLDPDEALAVLAREDLVHADATGRPVVAYPFSAAPRGHRVLIDGKHWVEAMCAIDALGIAPMLELPIEIYSQDPVSGGEIRVRLDPTEGAWWEPTEGAVLAGSACSDGPSCRGCCDVLNFFQTADNAVLYQREHPEIAGKPISLPDAIEAGRIVFGAVCAGPD